MAHRSVEVRGAESLDRAARDVLAGPQHRTVRLPASTSAVEAIVVTRGDVAASDWEFAIERVAAVVEQIDDKVLFAKVALAISPHPGCERPATVQVTLDIDGDMVRAEATSSSIRDAIALVHERLRHKFEHRAQRRLWLRRRAAAVSEPGERRRGDVASRRREYFDRPVAERQLVRHKSFAPADSTPEEAAFDLEQLDYDFYLFRDLISGEDSLIERGPDDGYRLTRLRPVGVDPAVDTDTSVTLEISDVAVLRLTVDEAIDRLDATGERFVFFANPATDRGNVAYHRHDGHYGLITLTATPPGSGEVTADER